MRIEWQYTNIVNISAFVSFVCSLAFILTTSAVAEIIVTDDSNTEIRMQQPAARIISLAPNLTELLFAAGAGDKIIATVRYSDYPDAAKAIPVIGDAYSIDMEAVMQLSPDLIVVWESGTSESIRHRLAELGFTVYRSEPDTLEQISSTLLRLGLLAGTEEFAMRQSGRFNEDISSLRQKYISASSVRVFYQFWSQPMFTVNGQHLISRIIELCGGTNIFSGLPALTPQLSMEAVLVADPAVIIASGENDERPVWLDDWKQWPTLAAVANNHLYSIPPDLIQRHTPRIIAGASMMCELIDRARN